jgi:hypothetical protein
MFGIYVIFSMTTNVIKMPIFFDFSTPHKIRIYRGLVLAAIDDWKQVDQST